MPGPLLIPLIAAGAALASSGINAYSQNATNKSQLRFSKEMYEKQKADNLAQWHLQNEYNSPRAQMQRLQQGGLNPNMVYGTGTQTTAGPVQSATSHSYNPSPPQYDLKNGLMAYFDAKQANAQASNLEAQNTVLVNEAALKAANIANVNTQTARSKFDLDQAEYLKKISSDTAFESLRKLQMDNAYAFDENRRRNDSNKVSIQESLQRISLMKQQKANTMAERERIKIDTQRLVKSNQVADIDMELRKRHINPNDPMYQRVIGVVLNSILDGTAFDKAIEMGVNFGKNFKN